MLLILCVDLDDDLGRKTRFETPVVGRDAVKDAAVALATADPEDSDVNVCFQGVHLHDEIKADDEGDDESVEVAVVTGTAKADVSANRKVGKEVDTVLASLSTGEDVRAIVVTDGAQDESVLPVIRSRVPIDGVRRVVVRQAQDLESMYYTIKQVLADPETRGTILIPLGILLLIYPIAVLAELLGLPGSTLGLISALLGLYVLFRGLGLENTIDETLERVRVGLFSGRIQLITYVVAAALVVVGGVGGVESIETFTEADPELIQASAAFVYGAVQWVAAAGVVAALGRITDAYLADEFRWRHLNAPFYVVAIAIVLHGVSAFFVALPFAELSYLAVTLTTGTFLGLASTLAFAVAEQRSGGARDSEIAG
jgi:putative membrane protein